MKILILANNDVGLYKFRRELLERLLTEHEVFVCLPNGTFVPAVQEMGCRYIPCEFNRHGMNPMQEWKLLRFYKKLLQEIAPDVVLTYTIKPNIYGGMACASLGIPYISNITGLGIAIENGGLVQSALLYLYRRGLRHARRVFFQNESNRNFMLSRKVVRGESTVLPGSGVNLRQHCCEEYPADGAQTVFLTIGRIMRDKGSCEIFQAAQRIHKEFPSVTFQLVGSLDGDLQEDLAAAQKTGAIVHLGEQKDVHSFIRNCHALIHASYHEGMSNVLLEAAATGRPVIATDVPGCRETFDDGISGLACRARNADSLYHQIRRFLAMSREERAEMGKAGRRKMEREFDRTIVIDAYMQEIHRIFSEKEGL